MVRAEAVTILPVYLRGVAIGFHASDIQGVSAPRGRFLILLCRLYDETFTLVNSYCTNQGQVSMLLALLRQLGTLCKSKAVLGEDLNILLNPSLDTISLSPIFLCLNLSGSSVDYMNTSWWTCGECCIPLNGIISVIP